MKRLALFVASLLLASSGFAAAKTVVVKQPPAKSLAQEVKELKEQVNDLKTNTLTRDNFGMVITSPYVGIRAAYDQNDLLVNLPSVNEDLKLLGQRQEISAYAKDHGIKSPNRPVIDLSGSVEGQGIWKRDFTGGSKSDIDLSRAELDVLGDITSWVTGFMVMSYDNAAPSSGARVTNSKLYINRGFITIGDFNQFPMYGTVGQMYVPFGSYNNFMVTTPLTQSLGRTKERAVVLGYSKTGILGTQDGFYGAAYGYKGDVYTSNNGTSVNGWGLNTGYSTILQNVIVDFGAGYINDIADSEGMQDTAGGTFAGFGKTTGAEQFHHYVPAVNAHGSLKYADYSLIGEYIGSIRAFDKATDMSFNGYGARPQALDLEANYNFRFMDKMSSFALGYGRTWDALAINLPQQSAFLKLGTSWFKSTIESIEYRHDWNYGHSDSASGNTSAAFSPTGAKTRDIVTAQVGVYF